MSYISVKFVIYNLKLLYCHYTIVDLQILYFIRIMQVRMSPKLSLVH